MDGIEGAWQLGSDLRPVGQADADALAVGSRLPADQRHRRLDFTFVVQCEGLSPDNRRCAQAFAEGSRAVDVANRNLRLVDADDFRSRAEAGADGLLNQRCHRAPLSLGIFVRTPERCDGNDETRLGRRRRRGCGDRTNCERKRDCGKRENRTESDQRPFHVAPLLARRGRSVELLNRGHQLTVRRRALRRILGCHPRHQPHDAARSIVS